MTRQPVVAGSFYPGSGTQLRAMLEKMIPKGATPAPYLGCVAPHAGYPCSGYVAGAVYARVEFPESVVILCPSHRFPASGFFVPPEDEWETPLGPVEIDEELIVALEKSAESLEANRTAHAQEHSAEVHVPFIQYLSPQTKIVPIVVQSEDPQELTDFGKALARGIRAYGRRVFVVASTDLTHYEPDDVAREQDRRAIDPLLALDPSGFWEAIRQHRITACGRAPVMSALVCCRELGARQAELVKYQTSGDTCGYRDSVVGYAGILFS